ncbi:GNAT family N-acetyltransferase [Clostridium sporogenes]|jgi:ribosomal protein S18 acetylase RimI-like enzyme|uniref:GNAT family N-acetyltransferase n=3 Tax=Clostridium sporogenes TaxID=1509 RepID=UPI00325BEAD6|nr:GNAT family N-acetyltransferase [Clostridium sporogenes]
MKVFQKKAFLSDYLLYGECPGYNRTNESMKRSIKQCYTFKIMDENTFIGDVIVKYNGNNNYYLGALCIIPEYENIGIGQKVMSFILTILLTLNIGRLKLLLIKSVITISTKNSVLI